MNKEKYKVQKTYYKEIPQNEIDEAVMKSILIICLLKNTAFPLMNIVVYDPTIMGIEKMRAIFRDLNDAIKFAESY